MWETGALIIEMNNEPEIAIFSIGFCCGALAMFLLIWSLT